MFKITQIDRVYDIALYAVELRLTGKSQVKKQTQQKMLSLNVEYTKSVQIELD